MRCISLASLALWLVSCSSKAKPSENHVQAQSAPAPHSAAQLVASPRAALSPHVQLSATPDWLLYVYMAADNPLFCDAVQDFDTMSGALSGDGRLAIIVMLDGLGTDFDGYYELIPGMHLLDSQTKRSFIFPQDPNSNDPDVLRSFVEWGQKKYAAKHNGLVFWGHGDGFDLGDVDLDLNKLRELAGDLQLSDPALDFLLKKPTDVDPSALDKLYKRVCTSASDVQNKRDAKREILSRIIALRDGPAKPIAPAKHRRAGAIRLYDQSNHTAKARRTEMLDKELASSIAGANLAMLIFATCDMAMIEAAYELRKSAQVMIASEDETTDYPLEATVDILQDKGNSASTANEDLAKKIVDQASSVKSGLATLSAIRLAKVGVAAAAVSKLASALQAATDRCPCWMESERAKVTEVVKDDHVRVYHVDILDLFDQLRVDPDPTHKITSALIEDARQATGAAIINNYAPGYKEHPAAHGLATFFPRDGTSFKDDVNYADYRKKSSSSLAFVREQKWADFIDDYASKVPDANACTAGKPCP